MQQNDNCKLSFFKNKVLIYKKISSDIGHVGAVASAADTHRRRHTENAEKGQFREDL